MESRRDRGTEPCGNRRLVAAIITQAKSKRKAIATAAVLLAAILALAWPHAMPMGNKDKAIRLRPCREKPREQPKKTMRRAPSREAT